MSACRGCGGTGIDSTVSPRRAQLASEPILMRRTTGQLAGESSSTFRGVLAAEVERRRMFFQGPLNELAKHVELRLKNGYQIVQGEQPDPRLACRWCNGHGTPDGQLTVRALEKLTKN